MQLEKDVQYRNIPLTGTIKESKLLLLFDSNPKKEIPLEKFMLANSKTPNYPPLEPWIRGKAIKFILWMP